MLSPTDTRSTELDEMAHPSADADSFGGRQPRLATVSLIIPTLNEAQSIAMVLPRIPDSVDEIVIVDAHSDDDTLGVVAAVCPRAVRITQHGRGKGDALMQGVMASRGDIIITMDADGSMAPELVPQLVSLLVDGTDFVKGSRSLRGGGSADFTPLRRFGNWALTVATNVLHGTHYTDITYGLNAYRRDVVEEIGSLSPGFEFEIEVAIRAGRLGMSIGEVPCYEDARIGGESKLHPFRDGFAILRSIVRELKVARVVAVDEATRYDGHSDLRIAPS
jgi:glycosyltransferase involved in cell wall biosynthesis